MENDKQKILIKILKYLFIILVFSIIFWIGFNILVYYYLVGGYYKVDEKTWVKNTFETTQANIHFKAAPYKVNFFSGHHRIEFEISIKNQINMPLCFYPQRLKITKFTKDKEIIAKEFVYQDKFFNYPSKSHVWSGGLTASSGRVFIDSHKVREIYLFIDSNQDEYEKIYYLDTEIFREPIFAVVENRMNCEDN